MAKKTAKKEKDYSQYGYKADSKLEIKGKFFSELGYVLDRLKQEEIKVTFNINPETGERDENPTVTITDTGVVISELLEQLSEIHVHNVDLGNALTKEEMEKPQLEIVTK